MVCLVAYLELLDRWEGFAFSQNCFSFINFFIPVTCITETGCWSLKELGRLDRKIPLHVSFKFKPWKANSCLLTLHCMYIWLKIWHRICSPRGVVATFLIIKGNIGLLHLQQKEAIEETNRETKNLRALTSKKRNDYRQSTLDLYLKTVQILLLDTIR